MLPHSACDRPINADQPLTAKFGENKFLVTYPSFTQQQFPHHVRNATVIGRLANSTAIVNVNFELDHDDEVSWRGVCNPVLAFALLLRMARKAVLCLLPSCCVFSWEATLVRLTCEILAPTPFKS